MSPMNRIFIQEGRLRDAPALRLASFRSNGYGDFPAAPFGDAWKDDVQLALVQRGTSLAGIDRAGDPDDTSEAAEAALGKMKRRALLLETSRRWLVSGDRDDAARPGDADRIDRHAGQI